MPAGHFISENKYTPLIKNKIMLINVQLEKLTAKLLIIHICMKIFTVGNFTSAVIKTYLKRKHIFK